MNSTVTRRLVLRVLLASGALVAQAGALEKTPAAAVSVLSTAQRAAWHGLWGLMNDDVTAQVEFQSDGSVTRFTLAGFSNSGFGCWPDGTHCRTAGCQQSESDVRFVNATEVQQDLDLSGLDSLRSSEPCRLEATLMRNTIRLRLSGGGCAAICSNYGYDAALSGDYRRVQQPSFDCRYFTDERMTLDEKLICLDAELAGLDRTLTRAYAAARSEASNADWRRLGARQEAWLKDRRSCEDRRPCLVSRYKSRLRQLSAPRPR